MKYLISFLFIACLTTGFAQDTRYIAHVPPLDGNFEAKIILTNFSSSQKSVSFHTRNQAGESNGIYSRVVPPNTTLSLELLEVFNSFSIPDVSHFFITGSRQVSVSLRISAKGEYSGSDSVLHEAAHTAKSYRIYPSVDPDGDYWEGLALTSLVPNFGGIEDSSVTITLKDLNNQTLDTIETSLSGYEKKLFILSSLFEAIQDLPARGWFYEVESEQAMAATVLKGNTSSLDVTAAPPVAPLPLEEVKERVIDPELQSPFLIANATLEDRALTISLEVGESCPYEMSLNWDGQVEGSGVGTVYLTLGLTRVAAVCLPVISSIEKEFDITSVTIPDPNTLTAVKTVVLLYPNGTEAKRWELF